MINSDKEVVLIDAGIVRFINETSITPTSREEGLGTRGYWAPEQAKNKKEMIDIRCDIFSTGIVLFETITNQHPFN